MATEIKKLDLKQKNFTANGNNYRILDSIPLSRHIQHQKMIPRVTYGVGFNQMFTALKKAYEHLNNKKFADSAVVIHNVMSGIADVENENRHDPALLICTLFIVRDGEDIGVYDEGLSALKIKDWEIEGYEINGFFHLALISIEGFRETFLEYLSQKSQD